MGLEQGHISVSSARTCVYIAPHFLLEKQGTLGVHVQTVMNKTTSVCAGALRGVDIIT